SVDEVGYRRHHRFADRNNGCSPVELALQHPRRVVNRHLWFPFRDGVVAADRRSRFFVKPHFRYDSGNLAADLFGVFDYRMDRPSLLCHLPLDWRHSLYCRLERWHDVAGSEDRISGGLNTEVSAGSYFDRRP